MQTIVAAFNDSQTAQQAIDSLVAHGFNRSAVHLQGSFDSSAAGGVAGTMSTGNTTASSADSGGFFAGVEHFFSNLFSDDDSTAQQHSGRYVQAVRDGRSVVAVDASSDAEIDKATTLLYDLGAVDVDDESGATGTAVAGTTPITSTGAETTGSSLTGQSASGALGAAAMGTAAYGASATGTQAAGVEGQAVMPVVQEELQVGKRTVQNGGIRVVKRITETPVSELVTLREERATVERHPVDRVATEADFAGFKEGTIEVREQSEEAVVGKTARVVEEVVVGKQVTEREETVSDTVRRTDVDVETIPATETTRTSVAGGTLTGAGTSGTTGTTRTDGTRSDI